MGSKTGTVAPRKNHEDVDDDDDDGDDDDDDDRVVNPNLLVLKHWQT